MARGVTIAYVVDLLQAAWNSQAQPRATSWVRVSSEAAVCGFSTNQCTSTSLSQPANLPESLSLSLNPRPSRALRPLIFSPVDSGDSSPSLEQGAQRQHRPRVLAPCFPGCPCAHRSVCGRGRPNHSLEKQPMTKDPDSEMFWDPYESYQPSLNKAKNLVNNLGP